MVLRLAPVVIATACLSTILMWFRVWVLISHGVSAVALFTPAALPSALSWLYFTHKSWLRSLASGLCLFSFPNCLPRDGGCCSAAGVGAGAGVAWLWGSGSSSLGTLAGGGCLAVLAMAGLLLVAAGVLSTVALGTA